MKLSSYSLSLKAKLALFLTRTDLDNHANFNIENLLTVSLKQMINAEVLKCNMLKYAVQEQYTYKHTYTW